METTPMSRRNKPGHAGILNDEDGQRNVVCVDVCGRVRAQRLMMMAGRP